MLLDALRHTDRSRRTDESAEVATYTLATHQSWHTTDAVKLQSLMATIGAGPLSEKARMHEYAANNGQKEYIIFHCEELIRDYETITERINEALK